MAFELDPSYKQVPERIADFKAKHPEGSLRPLNPERPFSIETIGDKTFVVYAAAAFRSPTDEAPGVGLAWEPFPGLTPYTKNSELQNAETSAWGRAIVAALASESKSVASAEDVRNRQADESAPPPAPETPEQRKGRAWARQRVAIEGGVTTEVAADITKRLGIDNQSVDGAEVLAAALEKFAQTGELPEPTQDEPQKTQDAPEASTLAESLRQAAASPYKPTEADKQASGDVLEERKILLGLAADLVQEQGWDDKAVLATLGSKKRNVSKAMGELEIVDLRAAVDALEKAAKDA